MPLEEALRPYMIRQRPLSARLHGALACLPRAGDAAALERTFNLLRESMARCEEAYVMLGRKSFVTEVEGLLLRAELEEEPAYRYILSEIEAVIRRVVQRRVKERAAIRIIPPVDGAGVVADSIDHMVNRHMLRIAHHHHVMLGG